MIAEGRMLHATILSYLLFEFVYSEDVGLFEHDMVWRAAHGCDVCGVGKHLHMCVDAACKRTSASTFMVL
jgi:hypothetical protein